MDFVEHDCQSLDAPPARLSLGGPQAPAMAAWLERVAGWQSFEGAAGALVPPMLVAAHVTGVPVLAGGQA